MIEHGFTDVAIQSAHAFRAIMQAMARPGRIMPVAAAVKPPEPLLASTAAVALTLCDFQTPLWLGPQLHNARVAQYFRFHAGVPIAEDPAAAQFAVLTAADLPHDPATLLQGTHEYPDRSATLVVQVQGFVPGAVELTGPGIPSTVTFGAAGLTASFWDAMAANHARFPVGIDVIFAAPGMLAALPRSTAIRMLETA